ncbi:GNAT family N-acetyltransferase [Streptomyces sp. NPDC127098]|uniref:GNAT family N-acetyltransferase n=1 Tax=Streptomyces sp. NPDC127098 TaxID=3347137 RepID=UPI003652214F
MTPAIRELREIRPATAADLEGVVSVFLGCWQESYPRFLPAPLVAAMTRERATALWRSALGEVRVAAADSGEILGVTRWATDGLIHSLYVAPHARGLGLGAALLRAATKALRSAGATEARLWCFRANEPALAFYRRQGWHEDGTTRVQDEFGEPEVRLTRALAAREAR